MLTLRVGAGLVALALVGALLGPGVSPHDPAEQVLSQRLEGPSGGHPFGRDELGRDILSRVLTGARVSLIVGVSVVSVSSLTGLVLGLLAGYLGGRVDRVIGRVIDILMAFPGILLAIAIVAVRGPGLTNVVVALTVIGWVGYARLVRGQVLRLRELEYVLAARALGAGIPRILVRHVLPATLPVIVVQATLGMAGAIIAEASLSFSGWASSRRRPVGAPCSTPAACTSLMRRI